MAEITPSKLGRRQRHNDEGITALQPVQCCLERFPARPGGAAAPGSPQHPWALTTRRSPGLL
eukprot:13356864-Alexandrium_andersonii.AAC.1